MGFVGSAGSRSELSKGKERTPEVMVQRMISHRPISSSASGAQQSDQDWPVMYQQKTSRNVPTYTYLGRTQIRLAGRRRSSHIVLFDVMGEGPSRTILEDPEQRAPWPIHQTVDIIGSPFEPHQLECYPSTKAPYSVCVLECLREVFENRTR